MSQYSIKDLEELSGVKSHTIRIWEQRYGLLTPKRTDTNIRYYDDDNMRKLLNIVSLMAKGLKISAIGKLTEQEINERIFELVEGEQVGDAQTVAIINQMVSSGLTYNEQIFEKAFSTALIRYGFKDTYVKVIYPMLVRIGILWSSKDLIPAQEHFISNLVRQKIYAAIDTVPAIMDAKETWVLFLPDGEDHELGLLLSAYLLRVGGKRVIYLGVNVSYSNLKAVIEEVKPDYIYFFLVVKKPKSVHQEFFNQIGRDFSKINVYASSSQPPDPEINTPKNFQWINSVEEFLKKV